MTDKKNGDELIEITPDVESPGEDEDMKVVGSDMSWAELLEKADENAAQSIDEAIPDEVIAEDEPVMTEEADGSEESAKAEETDGPEESAEAEETDGPEESAEAEEADGPEESAEAEEADGPEESAETEETDGSEESAKAEETDGSEEDIIADGHTGEAGSEAAEEADVVEDADFSREFAEIEEDEEDNALVMEIGESLSKQIQADIISDEKEREKEQRRQNRANIFARIPWWAYASAAVVCLIIGFVIWVAASTTGQRMLLRLGSRYAAGEMNHQEVEPVEHADVPDEVDGVIEKTAKAADDVVVPIFDWEKDESTDVQAGTTVVSGPKEVYNILIAGEENIMGLSERGRTDLLMIASINVTDGRIMLTSVLRDSLVAIPGNSNNKINAAYAIGGMSLLYETFEANLGVKFDNYILVNFDDFEKLIDMAGGVSVELSADEAEYLRKTNYITEKPNRKSIVPGVNLMNGDQALGYCRVRMVDTLSGENGDSGRSERQRRVMKELLGKISGMSNLELISFLDKCLPFLSTDLTAEDIELYVSRLADIGKSKELEMLRIPLAGSCTDASLRGMLVVQMDLDLNSRGLRYFIYGDGN